MAHFAKVVDGIVEQVIVADTKEWCENNLGGTWIQTSYNTIGNKYIGEATTETKIVENPEWFEMPYPQWCGKERYIEVTVPKEPLHKNYAGIGYSWDGEGFAPPQPYPSWSLDLFSYQWQAPVAMPEDDKRYTWDEATTSWVEVVL
jgi:hypothetical protein